MKHAGQTDDGDAALSQRWARIVAKLVRARPHLATAGYVSERRPPGRSPIWEVRYRERVNGKRRHRCICLGPGVLADRARRLIQRWRAEAVSPEEVRRQELLRLYDVTAAGHGYSRRARKRLRVAAEQSFGNPPAELELAVGMASGGDEEIRYGKRPGRPAQSGLW